MIYKIEEGNSAKLTLGYSVGQLTVRNSIWGHPSHCHILSGKSLLSIQLEFTGYYRNPKNGSVTCAGMIVQEGYEWYFVAVFENDQHIQGYISFSRRPIQFGFMGSAESRPILNVG